MKSSKELIIITHEASLANARLVWHVKMNFISNKSLNNGTFSCVKRFITPYRTGNCEEELPKKPFGRLSVVCWPTVGRLLTDCRPSVGRLLAVCWPTVGRLSADCRPFVGRQTADRFSPKHRLSVGRQSADKRPTVGRQLVMCR